MNGALEQKKNRLLAAADIVQKGEFAWLEKLYDFLDEMDNFREQWEAMKAELGETLPTELQTKFDTLSTEIETKKGEMDTILADCQECVKNAEKVGKEEMKTMSQTLLGRMDEFRTSLLGQINEVKGLIPEMPESFDPTDILNRVNEIEAKIPQIPDELKAEQIRDKLETLEGEARLKIEAIDGLREELDRLKKNTGGRPIFGGGFSVSALNIHMIDNELVGTGDDVVTQFSLDNLPSPANSLHLFVGGNRMFEGASEDYTISGTAITFLTAPPTGAKIRATYRV
jgi:hypothetical protein